MKKKLFLLACAIIFCGCANRVKPENTIPPISSSNEEITEEKESNLPLRKLVTEDEKTVKTDELFTGENVEFPNNVSSSNGAYSLDELENLDYEKVASFHGLNIRFPKRIEIEREEGNTDEKNRTLKYHAIFPKTDEYDIKISFYETLDVKNNYSSKEIKASVISIANEVDDFFISQNGKKDGNLKITQTPTYVYSKTKPAAISVIEDDNFKNVFLFVASKDNIICFRFEENKQKSNKSEYIVADFLSAMYLDGESPLETKKSFEDYSENISDDLNNEISSSSISFLIPQDMQSAQDTDEIKLFINGDENENIPISQVTLIEMDKEKKSSLKDNFQIISGENLPPAYVVPISKSEELKITGKNAIKCKIRFFMKDYTLTGMKYTIEENDKFTTLLVLGPIKNEDIIDNLSEKIIESAKNLE